MYADSLRGQYVLAGLEGGWGEPRPTHLRMDLGQCSRGKVQSMKIKAALYNNDMMAAPRGR